MSRILLIAVLVPALALASLPGGNTSVDLSDPEKNKSIQELGRFATAEISKSSNSLYHAAFARVKSAKRQVVAGIMYTLEIVMGESTCKKHEVKHEEVSAERCPLNEDGDAKVCEVKVWVKPWENFREVRQGYDCTSVSKETLKADRKLRRRSNNEQELIIKQNPTKSSSILFGADDHDYAGWHVFQQFVQQYNKTYADEKEMKRRYQIFRVNMKTARMLQDNEQGTAKYGPTEFIDMTQEEFRQSFLTPEWKDVGYPTHKATIPKVTVPDSWDWRSRGAVTEVKNQGYCGSCWAFSVTGNVEGQWAVKKGKLLSLSEQELVDCDKLDYGCQGGLPANAYREIMRLGGLETESEYPYSGHGSKCQINATEVAVYINDTVVVSEDEGEMAAWIFKNGPVSIGINAFPMQFYMGGIAHPWKVFCNPNSLNHGVLIVGFGLKGDKPFWIIKNSWGKRWGESGYYYVYRGAGVCGLNKMVTSAIVD